MSGAFPCRPYFKGTRYRWCLTLSVCLSLFFPTLFDSLPQPLSFGQLLTIDDKTTTKAKEHMGRDILDEIAQLRRGGGKCGGAEGVVCG